MVLVTRRDVQLKILWYLEKPTVKIYFGTSAFKPLEVHTTLHCVLPKPGTRELEDPSSTCPTRSRVEIYFGILSFRSFEAHNASNL
jgi:hypothetical protein